MILPGVTRDSILSLAREHAAGKLKLEGLPSNLKVSERQVAMAEMLEAQKEGRLKEVFGSGTAAIVSPVNNIGFKGQNIPIPVGDDGLGDVARVMVREVVGRQYGQIPSDWSVEVAKLDS
jgi:branched-chain amino acid aminotransferase